MNPFLTRPALLYRAQCGRCRVISWLIWLFTLGAVRRMPLDTDAADRIVAKTKSKLVLAHDGRHLVRWRAAGLAVGLAMPRFLVIAAIAISGLVQ